MPRGFQRHPGDPYHSISVDLDLDAGIIHDRDGLFVGRDVPPFDPAAAGHFNRIEEGGGAADGLRVVRGEAAGVFRPVKTSWRNGMTASVLNPSAKCVLIPACSVVDTPLEA